MIRLATVTSATPLRVRRDGDVGDVPAVTLDVSPALNDRVLVANLANTVIVVAGGGSAGDGIPVGLIAQWSGSVGTIPTGWQLADGTNGTVDLRDKFVVAAGGAYAVGATGGADSVMLAESQIPGHTHTGPSHVHAGPSHVHSGPSHTHGVGTYAAASGGAHTHSLPVATNPNANTPHQRLEAGEQPASGNATVQTGQPFNVAEGAHPHTITGSSGSASAGDTGSAGTGDTGSAGTGASGSTGGGGSFDNRPAYYALAFIQKVA